MAQQFNPADALRAPLISGVRSHKQSFRMNREKLQEILRNEQINESAYSLIAKNFDPDEALCLRQADGLWLVYYSERGLQTGKHVFQSEAEACAYMLGQLRADPTVRLHKAPCGI